MKILLLFIGIMILNACSLYKDLYDDPEAPTVDSPDEFMVDIDLKNTGLNNEWWKNFNDEKLNELVDLALENNYNYQIALKNVDISETYISQNTSYLFPQVNASFSTSRDRFTEYEFIGLPGQNGGGSGPYALDSASSSQIFPPQIFNIQALSASVNYEIDVWNQIRNSVKEAEANVIVSTADSNVMKLTLIGGVANSYFQIMALNAILDNFHQQYKAAKEITELTKVQFKSGLIDESEVYDAETQEEGILISIDNAKKQKKIVEFGLAYLISEYPENFHIEPPARLNKLHFTQLVPEGLPSQMMATRPDIQAAYFEVMSYGYIEKQTIADFLPSFNITGLYGYAYPDFKNLFDNVNSFWSYGLGASQYVFDYAIRESEHKRAELQFEASILSYKDTVVNAFSEVNTALISYEDDHKALNRYLKQDKNLKALLGISDAQYQAGLADYTVYLNTQLGLLQTEYNIANQQLLVIQDIIQIYKALGLGLDSVND